MVFSTLNSLKKGEKGQIYSLDISENLKKRLMDMGLIKGREIECLFSSAKNEISAYLVEGTVIALRREDAQGILVMV